ncbi:hypothetical protein BU251_07730 [Candidatus Velamenicoccus archaeovorus]|uniref:Uncharacterized protein n=2 Tax=Velamenicoccus archaeovorus TaxID=1930593 RepID=A0A410P6N8_VELA1|nr:hypothetical protein BU251_07730 [Candidatus Velamenicoccus archaeovorus]
MNNLCRMSRRLKDCAARLHFAAGLDRRRFSLRAGFTLLEIVIIVVVTSVLASLAAVSYFHVTSKAQDAEALNNLAAVRKAQLSEAAAKGAFVNATNTQEINERLTEVQIEDKDFTYKIVNVTADDFAAVAERVDEEKAQEKPIVIAMYADGHVGYTYASGSSSGGSSSYGGGGGSSGGGSSGGSSGGSLGGSSGSSGSSGSGSSGGSSSTGSSGDGSSGGSTGGGTVAAMGFTYPPVATGNDGFVTIGWAGIGIYPDSYDIYRSTSAAGEFELLYENWYGTTDYYTDLTVTNDTTYYYRIDAHYGEQATYSSEIFSATPSATSQYALQAAEALLELATSPTGATIAEIILLYDVKVGFGNCDNSVAAWYEPLFNTIRINLDEFSSTAEVQAAILAHEGTHAWWTNDINQGQPERGENLGDSIDQEYNAFLNGATVWGDIKGGQTDYNQDSWASVIAQGEADAKEVIRLYYPDLPEY